MFKYFKKWMDTCFDYKNNFNFFIGFNVWVCAKWPQNGVVAKQYMSDINIFDATAKHWVEEYTTPERNLQKKIKELIDMRFNEQQAKEDLEKNDDYLE